MEDGTAAADAADGRPSILWLPVEAADLMVTCDVTTSGKAGLIWRWDGAKGVGLTVDVTERCASVVRVSLEADSISSAVVDELRCRVAAGEAEHLRVCVRAHRVEVYIDNRWVLGVSMPNGTSEGQFGFLVDRGSATFDNLRIAGIEELS
jgi:hypothetical protein